MEDWFGPAPTPALVGLAEPAVEVAVVLFTVLKGELTGVRSTASSESMRYWGVCTATP